LKAPLRRSVTRDPESAALICDTDALLDYLVSSAPDHERFRVAIDRARTRYIPGLVLAELDYFLRDARIAMNAFMADLARGRIGRCAGRAARRTTGHTTRPYRRTNKAIPNTLATNGTTAWTHRGTGSGWTANAIARSCPA